MPGQRNHSRYQGCCKPGCVDAVNDPNYSYWYPLPSRTTAPRLFSTTNGAAVPSARRRPTISTSKWTPSSISRTKSSLPPTTSSPPRRETPKIAWRTTARLFLSPAAISKSSMVLEGISVMDFTDARNSSKSSTSTAVPSTRKWPSSAANGPLTGTTATSTVRIAGPRCFRTHADPVPDVQNVKLTPPSPFAFPNSTSRTQSWSGLPLCC